MSAPKMALLAVYAVIIAIAVLAAGSTAGSYALKLLLLLVAVHLVEMVVFYKRCREAGGSMPTHMLNVFLFGVLHARELKDKD